MRTNSMTQPESVVEPSGIRRNQSFLFASQRAGGSGAYNERSRISAQRTYKQNNPGDRANRARMNPGDHLGGHRICHRTHSKFSFGAIRLTSDKLRGPDDLADAQRHHPPLAVEGFDLACCEGLKSPTRRLAARSCVNYRHARRSSRVV